MLTGLTPLHHDGNRQQERGEARLEGSGRSRGRSPGRSPGRSRGQLASSAWRASPRSNASLRDRGRSRGWREGRALRSVFASASPIGEKVASVCPVPFRRPLSCLRRTARSFCFVAAAWFRFPYRHQCHGAVQEGGGLVIDLGLEVT